MPKPVSTCESLSKLSFFDSISLISSLEESLKTAETTLSSTKPTSADFRSGSPRITPITEPSPSGNSSSSTNSAVRTSFFTVSLRSNSSTSEVISALRSSSLTPAISSSTEITDISSSTVRIPLNMERSKRLANTSVGTMLLISSISSGVIYVDSNSVRSSSAMP